MGVRGLMTYLEQNCPNACSDVNIADLVQECSEATGMRTEIVVDGCACYSLWTRKFDWTVGLQVGELKNELERFVNAFRNIDADLVFFFDGLTQSKKRREWLRRRRDSMKKIRSVQDKLHANIPFNLFPSHLAHIPPNMTTFVSYVLKHILNCKVFLTVHESDEEIIDYVDKSCNAIIFTYDSDFIVSSIDSPVLSCFHFNIETMTTRLYDRRRLNAHLSLQTNELPYLAILAGNDLVDRKLLKRFHARIIRASRRSRRNPRFVNLMNGLAKYIKSDLPRNVSSNNHMKRMCSAIFGNRFKTAFLRMAHKSYVPNRRAELPLDDSPWSRILIAAKERLRNVTLPVTAWGVLSQSIYESSPLLEDYHMTHSNSLNPRDLPCSIITRSLRKRLYGILLFEKRDQDPYVTEWCPENTQSYQQSVEVCPEFPSAYHPGLLALWDHDRSRTQSLKWILFLTAVSPNIENYDEWISLPEDLVISTAVCYYLFEEKFLNFTELRALMVTILMTKFYSLDDLRKMERRSPDFRVNQISVKFSHTYSLVFSLFATCGYPIPLKETIAHTKFEPLLLRQKLQEVHASTSLTDLCHGKMDVMETFHLLKNIIYQSFR